MGKSDKGAVRMESTVVFKRDGKVISHASHPTHAGAVAYYDKLLLGDVWEGGYLTIDEVNRGRSEGRFAKGRESLAIAVREIRDTAVAIRHDAREDVNVGKQTDKIESYRVIVRRGINAILLADFIQLVSARGAYKDAVGAICDRVGYTKQGDWYEKCLTENKMDAGGYEVILTASTFTPTWDALWGDDVKKAILEYKEGNATLKKVRPQVAHYTPIAYKAPTPVAERTLAFMQKRMMCGYRANSEGEYSILFDLCALSEEAITNWLTSKWGFQTIGEECDAKLTPEKILFKKGGESKRSDGKRVLAVAHRDTVIKNVDDSKQRVQAFANRIDDTLHSPCFDDRIGIFTILYALPEYGCDVDILFTTDEESGNSTAKWFTAEKVKGLTGYSGEGSAYSHIVEFDRRGEDIVAYHYDDNSKAWKGMKGLLEEKGAVIGQGTVSDISYLALGAKGINVGVGYHNEHAVTSTCEVKQYLSNLYRYVQFYHEVAKKELSFPHAFERRKSYAQVDSCWGEQGWMGHSGGNGNGGLGKSLEVIREERGIAANIAFEGWASKNLEDAVLIPLENYTPTWQERGLRAGLKQVAEYVLYEDDVTGELFLFSQMGTKCLLVAEGERQIDTRASRWIGENCKKHREAETDSDVGSVEARHDESRDTVEEKPTLQL